MTGGIKRQFPQAKRYPNMRLPVQRGGVRMLRATLRITTPTKLVTAHVREQLIDGLDEKIREVEQRTGVRCPRCIEDKEHFDELVDLYTSELCDVELFALRHLIIHTVRRYDVLANVPNHHMLGEVVKRLDTHVVRNGGYDSSESVDNLSKLNSGSKVIAEYLQTHLPKDYGKTVHHVDNGLVDRLKRLFTRS